MWKITLDAPDDWSSFRLAARHLLGAGIAPDTVQWSTDDMPEPSLFGGDEDTLTAQDVAQRLPHSPSTALHVPRTALASCEQACMHAQPQRFALIYRWLYRVQQGQVHANDVLDADWCGIATMTRAVQREIHKMRAFVRFRPLERPGEPVLHIAWFEPEHHIVRANADFFLRRFTGMHWALLTPRMGLHWDGAHMHTLSDCNAAQLPAPDAGEALWLTYYQSTFNPARLKPQAMLREMPRRYWQHMPETRLITAMEQAARGGNQPPDR